MSKFEDRQKQNQDRLEQQAFQNSLINYFGNQLKATKTVDRFIGNVNVSNSSIPIYRTDHYLGANDVPEKNAFQYSRWTAIMGGVRISAVDYRNLMQILNVI